MDYRERRYFLISLNTQYRSKYDTCQNKRVWYQDLDLIKRIPSVKFGCPYNHFKNSNSHGEYDGETVGKYVQMLVSCRRKYADDFICLLKGISVSKRSAGYTYWIELTKEVCGQ